MTNLIIKGGTLALFFSLISIFIAYHSGFFEKKRAYATSPNGGTLIIGKDTLIQDSIKIRIPITNTYMSSTKSMTLIRDMNRDYGKWLHMGDSNWIKIEDEDEVKGFYEMWKKNDSIKKVNYLQKINLDSLLNKTLKK